MVASSSRASTSGGRTFTRCLGISTESRTSVTYGTAVVPSPLGLFADSSAVLAFSFGISTESGADNYKDL